MLVIDRSAPVLVHAWLGALFRNGEDELIGFVDLDPGIRPARQDGSRDVEVVLEADPARHAAELQEHASECAALIRGALARLPELKLHAVRNAPAGWAEQYRAGAGQDLLFLETIEVTRTLQVSLAFDFGDLDMLVLRLGQDGQGQDVSLRPLLGQGRRDNQQLSQLVYSTVPSCRFGAVPCRPAIRWQRHAYQLTATGGQRPGLIAKSRRRNCITHGPW